MFSTCRRMSLRLRASFSATLLYESDPLASPSAISRIFAAVVLTDCFKGLGVCHFHGLEPEISRMKPERPLLRETETPPFERHISPADR